MNFYSHIEKSAIRSKICSLSLEILSSPFMFDPEDTETLKFLVEDVLFNEYHEIVDIDLEV